MTKLSGKIAVITGGTGALGKVVVKRLLEEEALVITTHTGSESSVLFISDLRNKGFKIEDKVVDVSSESSVDLFFEYLRSEYSHIDILCNLVGGVGKKQFIEDISLAEWRKMIALNLDSCFLMIRGAMPIMKSKGFGRVINIASMPAVIPEAKRGGYGIAKTGVIALTKTVSEEVKLFENITINAIAPSIILTEENKKWGTVEDFKKWVTPEEITEMIIFLCSNSGAGINGQVIQMYGKV